MSDVLARRFAIRVAAFYGALFVIYGMHVPYFPVWLDWRGLTAGQISIIMAAPFFIRLVITPVVALLADRESAHREILIALAWCGLLLSLLLASAKGFWPIFALAVPLVIANATAMPLIETVAVSGMRRRGLDYGRMRLWGSLTFIVASFSGGIAVARYGGGAGVWLIALGAAVTVVAAHALPRESLKDATKSTIPIWRAAEPLALLRTSQFVAFLVAAGLVQAAHAAFLTFGTLIWQKQGLSGAWIGTLWAIGVLVEVALFAVSGRIARFAGPARLLVVAAAASVVRWLAMAFEPPLELLILLQTLHGVTYGVAQIGAIHFIHDAVPLGASGSAQALYATVASGVAMGAATLIAGAIYAQSGSVTYFAMTAIALASLVAALVLNRIWSGSVLTLPGMPLAPPDQEPVSPTTPIPPA